MEMVSELVAFANTKEQRPGIDQNYKALEQAEIYSASATVSAISILKGVDQVPNSKKPEKIVQLFRNINVEFFRTITSDDQLADALATDLSLRGIEPTDYVAVLSEWDTFYGRELPRSFEEAFQRGRGRIEEAAFQAGRGQIEKDSDNSKEATSPCPNYICRRFYFRGIDGESLAIPLGKGTDENETDNKKAGMKVDGRSLERSVGASQFDYLRRLARDLARLNEKLKSDGGIKAVGVLGSDVYDKLLVLQALHDRLPGSLFFTTDLDARYLHPAEYSWTRNLIVASGFGLELRANLQGRAPPFRDSYQAARFFAVQTALGRFPEGEMGTRCGALPNALQDALKPRLYEIGRSEAIDISSEWPESMSHSIHPTGDLQYWHIPWRSFGGFAFAVIVSLILVSLVSTNRKPLWFYCYLAAILLVPAGVVTCLVDMQGDSGEPFALAMGVSMWPAEAIRLFAACLALTFIVRIFLKLHYNNQAIYVKYFGGCDLNEDQDKYVETKSPDPLRPRWWSYFKKLWCSGQPANLRDYILTNRWIFFVPRTILALVLYFALAFILMEIFGLPNTPYRGGLVKYTDRVVLGISVMALVELVLIVTYVTLSFKRLINEFIS
ncbi:MAG: hypothetical protein ACU843_12715 [Gammaproteobacteria bacterium]